MIFSILLSICISILLGTISDIPISIFDIPLQFFLSSSAGIEIDLISVNALYFHYLTPFL